MRSYRTETRKYKVGCGELRVEIAFKGDESFHFILANLNNHDNQCGSAYVEALTNTLTALFRRIKPDEIPAFIKNLDKQRCSFGLESCPNAIAQALKEVFKEVFMEEDELS